MGSRQDIMSWHYSDSNLDRQEGGLDGKGYKPQAALCFSSRALSPAKQWFGRDIRLRHGETLSYQRLIQPPPPPRRLTQPPPPPPLIQPPPRTGPLRLTQPALAFGKEASQAPAPTVARIAAPDHFPMLRRNNRRSSNSVSVIAAFSLDDPLLIGKIVR